MAARPSPYCPAEGWLGPARGWRPTSSRPRPDMWAAGGQVPQAIMASRTILHAVDVAHCTLAAAGMARPQNSHGADALWFSAPALTWRASMSSRMAMSAAAGAPGAGEPVHKIRRPERAAAATRQQAGGPAGRIPKACSPRYRTAWVGKGRRRASGAGLRGAKRGSTCTTPRRWRRASGAGLLPGGRQVPRR